MEINLALTAFLSVTIVYILCIEIFSILLRLTGLPLKKSRFQVLSLITNTGYTTNESELIITDKKRRRLASIIIVFGYIFSATVITLLINIIFSIPQNEIIIIAEHTYILFGIMIAVIIMLNIKPIKIAKRKAIERYAIKLYRKNSKNNYRIINRLDENYVYEIYYAKLNDRLRNKTIGEIVKDTQTKVILIKKPDTLITHPDTSLYLEDGDIIVVVGEKSHIADLFLKEIITSKIDDIIKDYKE